MVHMMSSNLKVIHVKKHHKSHIAELGLGVLRYPKDGYTSFKNYQVPSDFSLTDANDVLTATSVYYEGEVSSACGRVQLLQDKTKYSKIL